MQNYNFCDCKSNNHANKNYFNGVGSFKINNFSMELNVKLSRTFTAFVYQIGKNVADNHIHHNHANIKSFQPTKYLIK